MKNQNVQCPNPKSIRIPENQKLCTDGVKIKFEQWVRHP